MTRGLLHCGVEVCFTWTRGPVARARPRWLAFVSGWHWSLTPSLGPQTPESLNLPSHHQSSRISVIKAINGLI